MGLTMQERVRAWRADFFQHKTQFFISLILLASATLLNYTSGIYVQSANVVAVPDLVLDQFEAVDLSILFVWGFIITISLYFLHPLLFNPKRLHYAIGMFSLLIAVRAGFIVLTHLKTPEGAILTGFPWVLDRLFFQNDMFFSGHAALPFMGYLIFEDKRMKYFMLASSLVMGIAALVMHQHYTIDVLSAFFITYGVYKIGNKLFD